MSDIKIIAKNKRAGFDYFLKDKFEAGLELRGSEVKSLRLGKAHIEEAFIQVDVRGEAWIHNLSIPPYLQSSYLGHEEKRKRKLLLHKKEIIELQEASSRDGLVLIPTILYFKNSKVKVEIATAKGKKIHDKRQAIKSKEVERKIRQGNLD